MNIHLRSLLSFFSPLLCILFLCSTAAARNSGIEAARAAASAQQWNVAAQQARAVLSRDPASVEALGILGEAELALGDTLNATTHFKRALSHDPQDPASLVPLVDLLLAEGNLTEADRLVSEAEKADKRGKLWEIKACRARVKAQQGDVTTAIQMLAEAGARNPDSSLYPKLLARLYRDRKIFALAIDNYRKAIALEPENAHLRFELAQVLLKNKQYTEAMDEFKVVREGDPNNTEVNYQIGRLYFAAGRFSDAIEPLQAAVQDRPDHFFSHYLLGQAYRRLERLAEAETALRNAYELRPDHRDIQIMLAQTLIDEEKFAQEISFLHSITGTNSIDAELLLMEGDAHYTLAVRQDDAGSKALQLDSALACYKRSLAVASQQPRVTYRVATIYYNKDRPDSAISYYKKTLALEPDRCGAIINMGYSYGRLKQWNDAIASLRRGVVCDPENVSAHAYLASILAAQDSTTAALKVYRTVVALDSNHGEAYGQMGLIHFNREQYTSAITNLRKAVTYSPNNGDYWSLLGYANWSQFLKVRETIRDSHDGLIPGDELLAKGDTYLKEAERGFGKALQYKPGDKDLKETLQAVQEYRKRLGSS